MESIIRCRKCGKKMKSARVDDYRIKLSCTCGFSEYRTAPAASKAINPHFSKESLLPLTFDDSGRLGLDICSVYLWDGEYLVLRASHGLAQEALGKAKLKIGEGITGSAVEARKPILVEDVSQDSRYRYFPETKEEQYKIKTMYSYPIFLGEKPFGVLSLQSVVTREFTEDEIYFMSVIANLILGAVKMKKRL